MKQNKLLIMIKSITQINYTSQKCVWGIKNIFNLKNTVLNNILYSENSFWNFEKVKNSNSWYK